MGKDHDLLHAVKNNDVGTVRKLLGKIWSAKTKKVSKKYNLNLQDEDGFTALHHAALKGNADITMALLDVQCDVNARDQKGMAPLHLASWAGKTEIARLLVDARACVNTCADSGDTPLHLACQHCNIGVVEVLLDSNVDSTVVNKNGESALDLACRFGHAQVVDLLLKSKDCNRLLSLYEENPRTADPPLHIACKTGREEIVVMLLDAGADINQKGTNGTALHEASLYGKTEVVRILLDVRLELQNLGMNLGVNPLVNNYVEWTNDADVSISNEEGHLPLDLVLQFTSTRASQDIKDLLRDASKNKIITAKALHDFQNLYDPTCLSFKTGDIIEILEKNESGRWKGKVTCGKREIVGYFPSSVVRITNSRKSRGSNKTISMNAGVLPVGNYHVVALPAASSQSSPVHGARPRMSSFGKPNSRSSSSPPATPEKQQQQQTNNIQQPSSKKKCPNPIANGLEESKLFNKNKESLQYVEVSVDNSSPPPTSPGSANGFRTQYAEVVLNSSEKEKAEDEQPPLPQKSYKQENVKWDNEERKGKPEDDSIWVKNSSDQPELPLKESSVSLDKSTKAQNETKTDTHLESQLTKKGEGNDIKDNGENENETNENKEEANSENEDIFFTHDASRDLERAIQNLDSNKPITRTPDKLRKSYEDMSLNSPDRESFPERRVQKEDFSPRKLDFSEQEPRSSPATERRQVLAYETVELNKHRPKDADVNTMLITDIDQETDPDYVVVNKGVSPAPHDIAPNINHSYENVPRGFESTEGTGKEEVSQNYEKMDSEEIVDQNYETMVGLGKNDPSKDYQTTPGYVIMENSLAKTDSYENIDIKTQDGQESAEYMSMKDGVHNGTNRDYINIKLPEQQDKTRRNVLEECKMDCDIVEEDIDTIVENSNVQLELENKLVSDLMESLEYESNQTKDEDYSTKVTKESSLECELGNTKLPEKLQSHERDLSDVRASQQQCRIPIIIIETEDEWKRREINDKTAGKCNKMTPPGDTEYHHYTRQVEDLEFEMRMEHFEKELSGTVKDDINKPKMTDVFSSLLQELESNMDGEGEASNNEEIEKEFETKLRDTEKGQGCSETSGEISCDANSYVLNMAFSMSAGAKEVGQDTGLSQKEQKQTQVEAKHDDGSESLKPMEESMMSMISDIACGFNNNTPKIESGVPDELFNYVTELSNRPEDFKEIKTAIFDTQGQEPVFIQDDIFERQDDVMLYEGLEGSAIQQLSRPLGYNFDRIIEVFQELDTGEYDELGEGLSEIVRGNDVVDEVFSQTVINPKGGLRGPVIEVIPSIISKRGVDRIESDLLDDEKESTAVLEDGDFNNEMSQMVKLCLEDQGNCLNNTEEETSIWKDEKELWDIPDECNSSNEIRSEPCLKCDKKDPINSIDNVATVSEKETGKEPVKKNLNQNELEWEDKREKEEQIGGDLDDVFKAEEENLISFEDVYNTVVTVEEIPHVEVIKDSREAGKIIEYEVDALSRASCGTEDCVAIRNDEVLTNNQAESNIFTSELTSETDLKIDDKKREKKRKVGKDKDEIDDDHSLGSNLSSFPDIRMLVEVMPLLEEDLEYSLKEAAGISTGSFENTDDVMNFREDQIIFSSQTCTDMKISKSGKAQSSSRIIEDAENQKPTNYNKIDKIMEENEIERDSTQTVSSGERVALSSGSSYGHLSFASAEDGLYAKRKEKHNSMNGRNNYRKDEEIEVIKKNELLFCGSTKRQREQEIEIATGLKKLKIDDLSEEEATANEKEELAYPCRAKSSPSDNDKKEKLQINENVKLETRDFKHAFEREFHHSSVLQLREIEDKEAQSNISTPQGNEVQNDQESREFLINLEGLCGREKYEDKETVDTEKNISTSEGIVQDGKENRAALINCDFQREVHTLECSIVDDNYTSAATVEEDILSIMSDESMKLERHERLTNFNNDLIIFDDCSQAFQEETFTPCFHGVTNSKSAGNESSTDMDAMQDQKTTEDENCGNFEQPILDFQGEMKQHDLKSTENCGVASGVGEKCANIADVTFILEQLNELLIEKRETDNEGVETLDQENEQELKDGVTQVITQDVTQDTENDLTQEVKHVKVPDQDVTQELEEEVTQDVRHFKFLDRDVRQEVVEGATQDVTHLKAVDQEEEEEVTQDVLEEITQDARQINLPDHDVTQEVVEDVTQDARQFKFLDQEVEEEETQEIRHFKFLDRDIRREVVEGTTQDVTHVKAVDHDLIQEEEEDITQEVVEEVTQDVSYVLEHEVTQEAKEGKNQDVTHRNVTQESEVEVAENEDTALGVSFEKRQEEKQVVSQEEQDLELEHKVMEEVTPEKGQVVEKEVSQEVSKEVSQEVRKEVTQEVKGEVKGEEVTQEVRKEVTQEVKGEEVTQEVRKEVTQEVKGEEVTQEVREKVTQVVRKEVSKEVTQGVKGKEVTQDVKGKEVTQEVKGKEVTKEVRKEIKGEEVTQELREKEVESKQEVTKENIHQLKGEISQNALPGIELLERKEAIFESENQGCTKLEQQPLELLVQGLGMNFKPQENGIGNTETRLKTVTNENSNQAESEKKINYEGLENEKETQDKFTMNLMPQGNQIENTETRLKREEIDDEGCEKEREEEEILAFQESEKDEDKENRIRSFEMLIHLETIIKELEIYRFEHDRLRVAFKTCIEEVMNNLNTMNKAIHLMETRLNQKIKDAHEEMKKCCGNLEANAATRLSIDTLLKSYSLTQHQFGNLRQRVKDLEIIFSALNINEIYEEISHEVSAEINAMDKRVRFTENDVSDLKLRVTELEKECSSLRTLTPIEERLEIQFGNKEIKTAKSFYKYNIQLNEKRNDNPVGRISDDCNEEMSLTRSSPVIASAQRYYGLDAEEV